MYIEFNQSYQSLEVPEFLPILAKHYSSDMMDDNELLHLAATIILANWQSDSYICEIGTYVGLTSVFMAQVLKAYNINTTILSIDPFERFNPDEKNPQGQYNNYLNNITTNKLDDVCIALACFSKDAARVLSPTIEVLLIDGSHYYDDVYKDISLYVPKVKKDGFIFIDDYSNWSYPDVVRAVDEYFFKEGFSLLHKSNYIIFQKNF